VLPTAEAVGPDSAPSQAVTPWRPVARHHPGKILLDLAVSLGGRLGLSGRSGAAAGRAGGVRLGDFDPTVVPRFIERLAADAPAALAASPPHTAGRAS